MLLPDIVQDIRARVQNRLLTVLFIVPYGLFV